MFRDQVINLAKLINYLWMTMSTPRSDVYLIIYEYNRAQRWLKMSGIELPEHWGDAVEGKQHIPSREEVE